MKLAKETISRATLMAALVVGGASSAFGQEVRGPESPDETSHAPSPVSTASVLPPSADNAPHSATQLGDIVVTARRVNENLQDVPVAVTAFSGADLQKQNAVRVVDAALLAPSFFVKPSSTNAAISLTIRGQVQADYPATLDPSVGTYVDGLYWARAFGLNADLLDIQSVQVLKGPQGTLFGRNTTGGAFVLQTNDPSFSGPAGLISATYGRFNERGATAVVNIPVVDDKVALRLAGSFRKRDGYISNPFDNEDYDNRNSWTSRVKLLLKPVDNFSVLLSADYFRANERPQPVRLGYIGPFQGPASGLALLSYGVQLGLDPVTAKAVADQYIASTIDTDTYSTNNIGKSPNNRGSNEPRTLTKTQTYSGTATLDTFFGAVKFIGGYRRVQVAQPSDFDGTPVTIVGGGPIAGRKYEEDLKQYSGELQITGKTVNDSVDFAAGILYFKERGVDSRSSTSLLFVNPNVPSIFDGNIDNDSSGVYGQATWHVTNKIGMTGGVRYSAEAKGVTLFNRTFVPSIGGFSCAIIGAIPPSCAASRHDNFESLSYTAGIDYKPVDDILVYVKTSKGFRSGGENLRAAGANGVGFVGFDPEIAYSYEAGFKSEFFSRRVRLNLAGYYTKVNDVQRTVTVATAGGINTIIGNAAKTRIYGGEAEFSLLVAPGLRFGANGAITRPKYLDYFDGVSDRSNDRFVFVPRYSWSLSGDYGKTIGGIDFSAHADYAYTGKTPLGPDNLNPSVPSSAEIIRLTTQPALGLLNARVGAAFNDGRYEVAIFGRNITDNRSISYGVNLASPLNFVVFQRREPATYGVTATVRFGNP